MMPSVSTSSLRTDGLFAIVNRVERVAGCCSLKSFFHEEDVMLIIFDEENFEAAASHP